MPQMKKKCFLKLKLLRPVYLAQSDFLRLNLRLIVFMNKRKNSEFKSMLLEMISREKKRRLNQ